MTAGGFLGYFSTLMDEGWMPWNLFDMREHWEDVNMNLTDFYNHTWVIFNTSDTSHINFN